MGLPRVVCQLRLFRGKIINGACRTAGFLWLCKQRGKKINSANNHSFGFSNKKV
jgi:hypothetical protein